MKRDVHQLATSKQVKFSIDTSLKPTELHNKSVTTKLFSLFVFNNAKISNTIKGISVKNVLTFLNGQLHLKFFKKNMRFLLKFEYNLVRKNI